MSSYEKPTEIPDYEDTFDSDGGSPEEAIVKEQIGVVKGEVDAFFDTLYKTENGDIGEDFGMESMNGCLERLEEARGILAGLGVKLPNANVNYDTTTDSERLHELGRWVYGFYDEKYEWRDKLR